MMLIQFRMLSDENDAFYRDYEVPYDLSLFDFHRFICTGLGYDPEGMNSFFASNAEWEKLQEYTAFDMGIEEEGMPAAMGSVNVGQIMHRKRDRLIYVFDPLNDRALYLEVTGARECANYTACGPRVTGAEGEAPDPFEPGAVADGGSIFDDVMGEFSDFAGSDSVEDEF